MHCHICMQETKNFKDEETLIEYYWCQSCEYIFKSPIYYQTLEEQKVRYDLHNNDANDSGYQAYFKRFIDFIEPYIDGCQNALDFGCGRTSLLANLLKEKAIVCDSYDPIYHPNLAEDKLYDLIVSTEVFEHLHRPQEIFNMLLKRLRRGGYLAIQTQFHANDLTLFKQWYYHHDETHIVFFRAKSFEVLSQRYGCKVLNNNDKNMIILQKL